MTSNAISVVEEFFEKINSMFGLSVECNVIESKQDKFPLCIRDKRLTVIPDFFNKLPEDIRTNIMAEMYSYFFLTKDVRQNLDINPGFMAKGICDKLGVRFYSDNEIEAILRSIRRKLYDDIENSCYFDMGMELRESAFMRYEVVAISRTSTTDTIISVKPIRSNHGKPEKQFTEEELYERCIDIYDLTDERVSMRNNVYVISGPSGVGKDTIVKELLKRRPDIHKTVSATTRQKRSNDTDGVDYYFISKDEFYGHQINGDFVESEIFDGEHYGTLFSEMERHPANTPLILVIDVRGRRNVTMRYPLTKSIFISPPSFEILKERIIKRNENTPEEIENRLKVAKEEMAEASKYTYTVINDDVDACIKEIADIIEKS